MSSNSAADAAYRVGSLQSYGGEREPLCFIEEVMAVRPLGTQPLGICSLGDGRIAMAGYFEPRVFFGRVTVESGVVIVAEEKDSVSGALYDGNRGVCCPPGAQPGGASRCQTVNPGPDGTIIISANASRTFYVLMPPTPDSDGRWIFQYSFTLPDHKDGQYRSVHSAIIRQDKMLTTEAVGDADQPWRVCLYDFTPDGPKFATAWQQPYSYLYLVDGRAGSDDTTSPVWLITDSRSNGPLGLYNEKKLVVPKITGNGGCTLKNGGLLIPQYGQELRRRSGGGQPRRRSFGGSEGTLRYVPAHLLGFA